MVSRKYEVSVKRTETRPKETAIVKVNFLNPNMEDQVDKIKDFKFTF